MNFEILDSILNDPKLKAALTSTYWSDTEAELVISALKRSGLSPRSFAQRAGVGYRRLYQRLQRVHKAQQAAPPPSEPKNSQTAAHEAGAQPGLPPMFLPLEVTNNPGPEPAPLRRPPGLKIRFYRPTPQNPEELLLDIVIPLW